MLTSNWGYAHTILRKSYIRPLYRNPMAKPIRATPTLRGEDAEIFVREMIKRENAPISNIDKILYAHVNKNRKYFESFLN